MKIVGDLVPCDVDSTLVFDKSDLELEHSVEPITVYCWGRHIEVYPHWRNIRLLEKFHNRGYRPWVQSHSGEDWAEAVCKALGLDRLDPIYSRKTRYYIDDIDVKEWYGQRVYRDFKG